MTVLIRFLILMVIASPVVGEMPRVEVLKQRRYVIRSAIGFFDETIYRAEGGAGLWLWEPEKGGWTRVRPLIYGQAGNGDGAALAGKEDRIVVQGTTFLEFDAATHRLLRRYSALGPSYREWGFRGPLVTEKMSGELGIPPGYYGYPYCPPTSGINPNCPAALFPGYAAPTQWDVLSNLLYRRETATQMMQLSLAKMLPGSSSFDPRNGFRYLALDRHRSRLWFLHQLITSSTSFVTRFGYLPISTGGLGDEVLLEIEEQSPALPRTLRREPLGLLYDPVSDSLLMRWSSLTAETYVSRRPADLSRPEETIAAGRGLPLALTTLAPHLPEIYEQVLPAIGKGPGAAGTFWRSDVWIFNPSDQPVTFSMRRVSKPQVAVQMELPAHGSTELADVLGRLGGGPASGGGDGVITDALVIESPYRWGAQLTVYSRTFTTTPDGKGTYGQSVPAVPSHDGYSTQLPDKPYQLPTDVYAHPPDFFLDLRYPGQFRHNLGVVNDSAEPLEVGVWETLRLEPTRTFTVASHSVANVSLENLLPSEMLLNRPSMVIVTTPRPTPIWMSMIDNKTGDGTFLPFMTFSLFGALDSTMAIPQVANTAGARGSYWRSDLYGWFPPPMGDVQLPPAFLYPTNPARCRGAEKVDTILIGPVGQPGNPEPSSRVSAFRRIFPDVVKQFSDCVAEGTTGALEMNVGSWMSGFSRTYTTREDGGTYGDMLPFYPAGGWPVQHFSGIRISSQFRINLGLYNGLDYPVVHRLIVYDQEGIEVQRRELTIEPRRSLQANITAFMGDLPPGLYGLTVIPVDSERGPGRSWAYVAIVDNETGDPTNLW